jgi:hypothetical protein
MSKVGCTCVSKIMVAKGEKREFIVFDESIKREALIMRLNKKVELTC